MSDNQVSPTLRFAGFTDDWEQRKVSDVAEIIAGGTPSTSIGSYWEPKEVPWLSSGEVNKKYITYTDNMISVEGMNHSSARMVKENSVLIALAGQGKTRGTVAINRIPLTTNQSIAAMTFNDDIVPEFVFSNLNGRYDEIRKMSSGDGARGGLNKQLVGDIIIPYTSIEEQKRVADLFTNLDYTITLHQRKLDTMKRYKQGMLQKMFPKEGKSVPEIRFPGFTDDWEQRKLGDYVTIVSGDAPSKFDEGSELYVKVDDLNYNPKYIIDSQSKVAIHESIKKAPRGSVVFPKRGAAIMTNKVRILAEDSYMDTNMMALSSDKIDSEFLYNFISKEGLYKIADTSTIPQINNKHIEPYVVLLPELYEQIKIGEFFAGVDNLITLHQRKLNILSNIKKAMLQKMFPVAGRK